MAIVIETEKVVNSDGKLSRKVLKVDLLRREQVPKLYFDNHEPAVAQGGDGIYFGSPHWYVMLSEKHVYSEEDFQEKMKFVYAAGKNLQKVNAKLAKLREDWNGAETFVI